jgi:DNA-binding LacI/PurR family transcriptional regulator
VSEAVRLSDVARAAGVSLGTASNAFNRPEKVRPEVRARVEDAARALGYSGPDPKGRLLMGGKVNAIGVIHGALITTAFENEYLREFMAGAAEICDEVGAALLTISSLNEEAAATGVRSALVDGFILHNPRNIEKLVEKANARRLPVVAVDSDPDPRFNSIHLDSRGGARQAARHLIGLGHRRFAVLAMLLMRIGPSGPSYHAPGEGERKLADTSFDAHERWLGYGDALAEAGLPINQVPVVESSLNSPGVSEGARMLLDAAPDATAVLAMSDSLALAVIEEAHRRGMAVPRDLSVVGFDDISEAASAAPPLTTVAQPIKAKGRAAARMILEPPAAPRHQVLPVKLIVRGSTAQPPQG